MLCVWHWCSLTCVYMQLDVQIHSPTHPHTHTPSPHTQVERFINSIRNQPSAAEAAQVLAAQRAMRNHMDAQMAQDNADSEDSDVTVVGELSMQERLAVWVASVCVCVVCV